MFLAFLHMLPPGCFSRVFWYQGKLGSFHPIVREYSFLFIYLFLFPAPTKVSTMKQMAQIVYVSPCPNCVRGVCKIKKHHQLLYHRHQFVPILESASTSGSTTPNRLQMLEQSATSAGSLKSTPNQKQSKTADCRCLIQFSSSISQNPGFLGIYPDSAQIPCYLPWLGSLAINLTVGAIH